MFTTIADFEKVWTQELEATQKMFESLTDESLSQAVTPQDRTLGRMAWHIAATIPEMMEKVGLTCDGPGPDDPVPPSAVAIGAAFTLAARSLLHQVKSQWTNETLQVEDDLYGMRLKRGDTLASLILHQAHHRGQMTVLMRQAGLKVAGVYGPAREEWVSYGMQEPEI